MARDYMDLGAAPYLEDPVFVGSEGYEGRARAECIRFVDQLRRTFGPEPAHAQLRVKENPHDFGYYFSVVCYFNDDDEESTQYAKRCESECPARWDTPIAESAQLAAARPNRICSSCMAAMEDEGGIEESGTLEQIAMMIGGEMPDHLCDVREAPDLKLTCACSCN